MAKTTTSTTKKKTTTATKSNITDKNCPVSSSICQKNTHCLVKRASLVLSFASLAFSLYLWFNGLREEATYVGLWVPTILILGNYCNKS